MIEFRQISKRDPNGFEALKNVSLTIGQGEFVAIIGLSGAGKPSILNNVETWANIPQMGYPSVCLERMIRWQAQWILDGGSSIAAPTHFDAADGVY